jgi:hypothetical protein
VDKDSVKVEGSGLAIITNISVSKEDNHEIFEEIYPEYDDSVESRYPRPPSTEDSYNEDLKNLEEIPELKEAKAQFDSLQDEYKAAEELGANASERLTVLDHFSKNLGSKGENVDIAQYMSTYRAEREKMFADQKTAEQNKRDLLKKIEEATIKVNLYLAKQTHQRDLQRWEKQQADVEKRKEEERQRRRDQREASQKNARKKELLEFWPKYCFNVTITLDCSPYTPGSSRRNSTTSEAELVKAPPATTGGDTVYCDLVLSYITTSAFWAPSYDMQLNSTSASGTLLFDAQLHNSTSETWSNCNVTLSTSQATATSIEEPIPALVPWHIRLIGKHPHTKDPTDDISLSKEEKKRKEQMLQKNNPVTSTKARSEMFRGDESSNHALQDYQMQLMLLEQQNKKRLVMGTQGNQQDQQQMRHRAMQQQAQMQAQAQSAYQSMGQPHAASNPWNSTSVQPEDPRARRSAFGGSNSNAGGLFGNSNLASSSSGGFGSVRTMAAPAAAIPPPPGATSDSLDNKNLSGFMSADDDSFSVANTESEALPALDFKDSLVEETGLTTAYDLPGTKTLAPGATSSKHRVARLSLSNIAFSYTVVARYKPVAYLKAKIRNGSKLTLLRGTLGLTLDGGFMGRTMLPRCSAGETLTLPLGIDPSIRIQYPGPDVRRATTGLFTKEDSSIYSRTITIENTRSSASSKPCHIFVHDQIPVSEDERLKVELITPRGLTTNAGAVKAGVAGTSGIENKGWGEADAIMKENGTISWNVRLNPGKATKLELEYAVTMPGGGGHSAISLA